MSVCSQDVYLNNTTPLQVISGGGGGSTNPNPEFSTVTSYSISNLSSINGVAYVPGSLPTNAAFNSVSTGTLQVGNINGAPYNPGVPGNLAVSTLRVDPVNATNSFAVTGNLSTINMQAVGVSSSVFEMRSFGTGGPIISNILTNTSGFEQTVSLLADNSYVNQYLDLAFDPITSGTTPSYSVYVHDTNNSTSQMYLDLNVFSTANIACDTINVPALTGVSTLNGANVTNIPRVFDQPSGLQDSVISSVNASLSVGGSITNVMIGCGAPLTGNISTVQGHKYVVNGCLAVSSISGGFPAGAPNAYMSIWGGGGTGPSWVNNTTWSYPQISTLAGITAGNAGLPFTKAFLQWSAPGGFTQVNQQQPGQPGNSTITYYAYCSPDWPIPVAVSVSSLVGTVTASDLAQVTVQDLGPISVSGSG